MTSFLQQINQNYTDAKKMSNEVFAFPPHNAPNEDDREGNKLALMVRVRFYFITADGDATRLCSLQPKISSWPVTSYRDSGFRPAGSFFCPKRAWNKQNSEGRKCKATACLESRWWGSSVTTTTKIHVTETTEASAGQNVFRTISRKTVNVCIYWWNFSS